LVKAYRFRLGIDNQTCAAVVICHLCSELTDEPKKLLAKTVRLDGSVNCKPREPKDRQGIPRHLHSHLSRQPFDVNLTGSYRREAEDAAIFDRDVGQAEVMTKLVLPGVSPEETIESFVT